jgi:hypothetical protein
MPPQPLAPGGFGGAPTPACAAVPPAAQHHGSAQPQQGPSLCRLLLTARFGGRRAKSAGPATSGGASKPCLAASWVAGVEDCRGPRILRERQHHGNAIGCASRSQARNATL